MAESAQWSWIVTIDGPDGRATITGASAAPTDKPRGAVADHIMQDIARDLGYAPVVLHFSLDRTR
ncbi:hypothetical protein [Streptomonospora arabica]|uniref:Uncharacterized protein n=1 Tax=Streptomonospora arabica TaxID=412417 RepID=A0ABV9SSW4_9ACTN